MGITQPIGSKQFVPELGVANFGLKPANIELLYSSAASASDAPQEIVNISIPPLSSADVPIPDLSADPRMQNSFSVVTDADNGQVISTLHSRSTDAEQIVDLPDQDQKKLANGGQHPWIVDRNTSSYLLLYNAVIIGQKCRRDTLCGYWPILEDRTCQSGSYGCAFSR